jgi:hypothetical protein
LAQENIQRQALQLDPEAMNLIELTKSLKLEYRRQIFQNPHREKPKTVQLILAQATTETCITLDLTAIA